MQGNAAHRTATQRKAKQRKAKQRIATQSNSGWPFAIVALPGRFDHTARVTSRLCINEGEIDMTIQAARITVKGMNYLLQNNPQTADPFNKYAKAKKAITAKRIKTDDDLIELGNLETESKIYFDDELGVYVPTRWLTEAICTGAHSVIKVGRDKMRGGIFATEEKAKLTYDGQEKVKTIADVVLNPKFRHRAMLPQGKVRVAKDFPISKNWGFSTVIEYDDTVVDFGGLTRIVQRTAQYVGFGDFRPTFGRATAEVTHV